MQLKLRMLIILSLQTLFGKLNLKEIESAFTDVKKDTNYSVSIEELKSSIANPIFGFVFESSGALTNLRMFGPDLKIAKVNNKRSFPDDKSTHPLVQLLIYLFPSDKGVLSHKGEAGKGFESRFMGNTSTGPIFLADMVLKLLNKNYKVPEYKEFRSAQDFFDNIFLSQKYDNQNGFSLDDVSIKVMAIHSFMINCFDDASFLTKYLKRICDKIKFNEIFKYDNNLDSIIVFDKHKKQFPFDCQRQLPSFMRAMYLHSSGVLLHPRDRKINDNRQSLFLLDLCNCIFFDSKNQKYSTGNLDKKSKLAKFYEKNNELFIETDANIIAEWEDVTKDQNVLNFTNKELLDLGFASQQQPLEGENVFSTENALLVNTLFNLFELNNHIGFLEGFKLEGTTFDKLGYLFTYISFVSKTNLKIERAENYISLQENPSKAIEKLAPPMHFYLIVNGKYKLLVHNEPKISSFVKFISYPELQASNFSNELFNKGDFPFEAVRVYISRELDVENFGGGCHPNFPKRDSNEIYPLYIALKSTIGFTDKIKDIFRILYFSPLTVKGDRIQYLKKTIIEIIARYNSGNYVGNDFLDDNKINNLGFILDYLRIIDNSPEN